jgi:PST family polysaccharide transporter
MSYIIELLYTAEFLEAVTLLQWMLISVFLRFIGYPIGYVFLAKGKSRIFIFTQTLWNVLFISFILFFFNTKTGLEGIGIAYTLAYFIGVFVNYAIIVKVTRLSYDKDLIKHIVILSLVVLVYFVISYKFDSIYFFIVKLIGSVLVVLYSYREIEKLLEINIIEFVKSKFIKNS